MKKSLIFFMLLLSWGAFSLQAQNNKDVIEEVKNNKSYLYGEGTGGTLEQADENAIGNLLSKLKMDVSYGFEQEESEQTSGGAVKSNTSIKSKVTSYSFATFNNSQSEWLKEGRDYYVLRYIPREEIERIYDNRKGMILSCLRYGRKAENDLKLGVALKNYFKAQTYLNTLQHPGDMGFIDENGETHLLEEWLPNKINEILFGIKIKVKGRIGDNVELEFTYNDEPVADLDFSYYNGKEWEELMNVKDGRGFLRLGTSKTEITLKIEYMYLEEAEDGKDGDVSNVYKAMTRNIKENRKAKQTITVPRSANQTDAAKNQHKSVILPTEEEDDEEEMPVMEALIDDWDYRDKIDQVLAAIKSGDYEKARSCFTEDGFSMFKNLMKYGKARVFGTPKYYVFKNGDKTVVRSIPMSFTFKKGARKTIVEDVVFTFDADDRIECVAFALDKQASDNILGNDAWSESARFTILDFMENYKTAYCLEDLDYIDKVFSDDALIIVGHVLKTLSDNLNDDRDSYRYNSKVKKTQYSKQEYIKHLAACFNRNECIHIHFADCDLLKAGRGGELYQIRIQQDYYSTTYGDSGWLFLLVDLNNPEEPIIHVRAWQEIRTPEKELITIFDFD